MQTGKVTGFEIAKNKGSEGEKLLLQVEISDPDDIQTIQLMQSAGENSPPPNGSRIIFVPIGTQGYKLAFGVDDGITPPTAEAGEKILYSSDDGTIKAFLKLLKDGVIEINGNADNAVRYSALETAYDQLKSEVDQLITDINLLKPHTHTVLTPDTINGSTTAIIPVVPPQVPSIGDITGAKIEEIKVP